MSLGLSEWHLGFALLLGAQGLLRRDEEQFIRTLAEEVGYFLVNVLRPAY